MYNQSKLFSLPKHVHTTSTFAATVHVILTTTKVGMHSRCHLLHLLLVDAQPSQTTCPRNKPQPYVVVVQLYLLKQP